MLLTVPEAHHQHLGKLGEDLACRELERRGYTILARRYRTRLGEIDIVARDGETLVFVEVKARGSATWGHPTEAITPGKRRRLARMAADYLARRRAGDCACRFDVVTILMDRPPPKVTLFRNAFGVDV